MLAVAAIKAEAALRRAERHDVAAATGDVQLHVHVRQAVIANHSRRPNGAELLAALDAFAAIEGSIEDHMAQHRAKAAIGSQNLDATGLLARREGPRYAAVEWRQYRGATRLAAFQNQVQPVGAG